MTDKQLQQVINQLSEGEKFKRAYNAYEGGIRVISEDKDGYEYRYKVIFDENENARIEQF